MKTSSLFFVFALSTCLTFGQNLPKEYFDFVKTADSLYTIKDFRNSAINYSEAFKANAWKGLPIDYYNAACSWALAAVPDSAFFQLNRIDAKSNIAMLVQIDSDSDLNSLHNDKRWKPFLKKVKQIQDKAAADINKTLVATLDSIFTDDQKYRQQIDEIQKKYGWESKERKDLWNTINETDSVNLIKVIAILDKYGWLGADAVGERGNTTLFLIIQHSNQTTQEKHLPMMREAVKNGKAKAAHLALLEDRVALGQGKRQIYGSQIGWDPATKTSYVSPLEDPDNVDKRRAEVGLEPLSEYLKSWKLTWDVEQYKKDLPKLEEIRNNQ